MRNSKFYIPKQWIYPTLSLQELFLIWTVASLWVHFRTFFLLPMESVPTDPSKLKNFSLYKSSFFAVVVKNINKNGPQSRSHLTEKAKRPKLFDTPLPSPLVPHKRIRNISQRSKVSPDDTTEDQSEENHVGEAFYISLKSPLFWFYTVAFTILSFRIKV